ncbi:hypothetical protein ACWN8V_07040 [Vagococcus elongatus]|uniref:Uncharacterized protein n=1 Tax=Vagococcus elongatus TaxID=180344 RepID=A0A430AW62_9ENTE|nr:hypothetical protein [Vagococcus elongatus]RSU12288.1 hypothetical protein CBF29_06720 [Vagococcus elongatus]
MSLRAWFKRFDVDKNSTTETITNECFSFLGSCEELSVEDKKYLNELGYSDGEISEIEEIMDEK